MADTSGLSRSSQTIAVAVSAACAGMSNAKAAELEEIIVTSQKREQSLQDVPLAITAFTDADIVRQGFKTFRDYAKQIPSLSIQEGQPGATQVLMRGCATQGVAFGNTQSTSVYLDEQPISAAGVNPDPRLVDIQRVEALAGPQGTLFGEAGQCGTLRIITNKPDTEQFGSWVDLTGSTIDGGDSGYDLSAMVNFPIAQDKLALRLVGFYAEEPGWIDNVLSPSPGAAFGRTTFDNSANVADDINSSTSYGGRAMLRWNMTENWTADIAAIYQKYELDGFGEVDTNQDIYADTSIYPVLGEQDAIRFESETWNDEWYQLALTIEGDLGFANLTVAGAYFNREFDYQADSTAYHQAIHQVVYVQGAASGIPAYVYYAPFYNLDDFYGLGGDPRAKSFEEDETERWTIEARLASNADSGSRWGWLAGAFYNKTEETELFRGNVDDIRYTVAFYYHNVYGYINYYATTKTDAAQFWTGYYVNDVEEWALFGEVSYGFTENFTLTVGGRYYDIEDDTNVIQGRLVGLPGEPGIKPTCPTRPITFPLERDTQTIDKCLQDPNPANASEDGFVPKVNLAYTFNEGEQLIWATYSEGFRRGGVNSAKPLSTFGVGGPNHTYDSDTVENWEIGAKTEWLDNRLRFNITVYTMQWDDIQLQILDPSAQTFTLGIVNVPEAEINGVESWLNWAPGDAWSINATLGWNDAETSADLDFEGTTIPEGTRLPLVPDWKGSLGITYTFQGQLFSAEPYILGNYTYWGDSTNSIGVEGTLFDRPIETQPSWQTLDLRAGLDGETWSVALFIDNVFDEYAQRFFNNRWAQQRSVVNQPRTFGINARFYFGQSNINR